MANTAWQRLKDLWSAWKRLAHKIGNFQARVLLSIIYVTVVLPFGVISRLLSDPLRIKHRPTAWLDHAPEVHDATWAHKQ